MKSKLLRVASWSPNPSLKTNTREKAQAPIGNQSGSRMSIHLRRILKPENLPVPFNAADISDSLISVTLDPARFDINR